MYLQVLMLDCEHVCFKKKSLWPEFVQVSKITLLLYPYGS